MSQKLGTSISKRSQRAIRTILAAVLTVLATSFALGETPTQRVGLPLLLEEVYLKGPLLEPVPRKNREVPLIVRLVETKPAQDGFRYTFEVQGLDPGEYNLGNYLQEQSAESGVSAHQIPLIITTALPPGLPPPADLAPRSSPRVGGYRALIWILGLVWVAGLAWLFFSSRKVAPPVEASAAPATLEDKLKPLLLKASQGELATEEQARLERLILAHWRERVPEVAELSPAKSLSLLREHPEASPLLLKLEHWLHAPESQLAASEIESLLEPYRT